MNRDLDLGYPGICLKGQATYIIKMTLSVSDLMRKKVDTIEESDSIQETAKK